jgi:hypothetical protein
MALLIRQSFLKKLLSNCKSWLFFFCLLPPILLPVNNFYLTKITNPLKCAVYVILLVLWVCRS